MKRWLFKLKAFLFGKRSRQVHFIQGNDVLPHPLARDEEEAALIERNGRPTGAEAFALLKKDFDSRVAALKRNAEAAGKKLSNAFAFLEEVFGEGQELLILVTELTINAHSSRFISRYGCKEYFAHNKELLFYERRKELIEELGDLNFD